MLGIDYIRARVRVGRPLGVFHCYLDGNSRGEKWLHSGYILEGDLLGFPDVGCDREKRRDGSNVWGLSN